MPLHCIQLGNLNADAISTNVFSGFVSGFHLHGSGQHNEEILTGLCAPVYSIGLDTCLAIQQTLYTNTGDSKYRPSVLLERMVDAQWLGKKSGKGFYDYSD